MTSFVVIVGAAQIDSAYRLVSELRGIGVGCVAIAEPAAAADVPVSACNVASACTALAAAGIAAVVIGDPPRLLADLPASMPRVLAGRESAAATIDELRASGWLPADGEAYTDEELQTVTARLQDLGYA